VDGRPDAEAERDDACREDGVGATLEGSGFQLAGLGVELLPKILSIITGDELGRSY
jgi:hypothetical protein